MNDSEVSEIASLLAGTPAPDAEPETESPDAVETPDQEIDTTAAEPEQPENQDIEDDEGEPEPLTMKSLAEKLEIKPKDLYDVELGDGLTIGQLKDRFKELEVVEQTRTDAELHKVKTENEVMQQRRALETARQELGIQVTPQQQERANQQFAEYVSTETARTMEAIPEWSEPTVLEADRQGMQAMLAEYGLSEMEMTAIVDHRQVKMLRDFHTLRQLVANAGTEVKPKSPKKAGKRRTRQSKGSADIVAGIKSGAVNRNDGIAALLADGMK